MALAIMTVLLETKKYSNQYQQGMYVIHINFEIDTEPDPFRKKYKQSNL